MIGISGTPALVDGGSVTAPSFAIFSKEGQWIIESHGVDPDIDVVDDPAQLAKGVDPQLERAIQEALTRVEKNPKRAPAPAYPQADRTERMTFDVNRMHPSDPQASVIPRPGFRLVGSCRRAEAGVSDE